MHEIIFKTIRQQNKKEIPTANKVYKELQHKDITPQCISLPTPGVEQVQFSLLSSS